MKIGTNDISKIYLGGSEINSIYLGTTQVYSGGSSPEPSGWVSYHENQEVPTGDTIYGIRVDTNAVSPTGGESMDFSDGRSILYSATSHKWQYLDTNLSTHDLTIDQDGYISMKFSNGATITFSSVNTNYSAPYYFPFDCELNYQAPSFDYTKYLRFDIVSGGTINWVAKGSQPRTISYSLDGGNSWSSITSSTAGTSFNVSAGDKVLWKGTNTNLATNANNYSSFSGSTAAFNIKGNIMSLIYGDDFEGEVNLSGKNCCFVKLFYNTTNLINAENLILPATTLSVSCYLGMFNGCTSLTTAPELPATTLAISCYNNMFYGCTSLTTAPVLPATTLASSCYKEMFYGCTSLTTAPALPATTLVTYCYQNMFYDCTSLNSITCLATDISASYCTSDWVALVAASGTFTKAANMCDWTTGYNGIPNNWTVTPDDCFGGNGGDSPD